MTETQIGIRHSSRHTGMESLPYFLGFDLDYDGNLADPLHVMEYANGFITLDGASGPWFARQRRGKYAGVVVELTGWGQAPLSCRDIIEDVGFEIEELPATVYTNNLTDDNIEDELFSHVEPSLRPRPDHVR